MHRAFHTQPYQGRTLGGGDPQKDSAGSRQQRRRLAQIGAAEIAPVLDQGRASRARPPGNLSRNIRQIQPDPNSIPPTTAAARRTYPRGPRRATGACALHFPARRQFPARVGGTESARFYLDLRGARLLRVIWRI